MASLVVAVFRTDFSLINLLPMALFSAWFAELTYFVELMPQHESHEDNSSLYNGYFSDNFITFFSYDVIYHQIFPARLIALKVMKFFSLSFFRETFFIIK
ncbi:hypothetical protein EAO21_29430 [Klebsiella pneumoniae]|nr:hypothetical protein EAO21_29430 [Klebsiella pneumoniae]